MWVVGSTGGESSGDYSVRVFDVLKSVLESPPDDKMRQAFPPATLTMMRMDKQGADPPLLPPGQLRPLVRLKAPLSPAGLPRVMRLLLLAPEVLLMSGVPDREDGDEAEREMLRSMDAIRPLVESGSIVLTAMLMRAGEERRPYDGPVDYFHVAGQLRVLRWCPGAVTPVFRHEREREIAEEELGQVPLAAPSRRALGLPKLAALELPILDLQLSDLVAARQNDEAFAEWRQQLGNALEQVELLPDRDGWQSEARGIIADELARMAPQRRHPCNVRARRLGRR